MGLLQLLFSFKGRLNRQGFWVGIGINFVFLFIVICYFIAPLAGETNAWLLGLLMPMLIGTIVFLEWGFFASFPQGNQYGEQGLSLKLK